MGCIPPAGTLSAFQGYRTSFKRRFEATSYTPVGVYPARLQRSTRTPGTLEIVFKPDPAVWDGRFANNGWLQELPKPITKLTWDNAALVSPKLAERLHLNNEDVVELAFKGHEASHAPVWIVPGQAENSVTLTLGYGRTAAGNVGTGQGVNAYCAAHQRRDGFRRRAGGPQD